MKSFASDNYSGVHPEIFSALQEANQNHEISYGDDIYTKKAIEYFQQEFGNVSVLFTFNGTGANVISLKCYITFSISNLLGICTHTCG